MKKFFLCLMALMMFATSAMADSVTLEGAVVSTGTVAVLAPAAGTLNAVLVQPGDAVKAGTEVASLMSAGVYAKEEGVVRLFGQEGDAVESLTERYGAVAFVEPEVRFTLSASTRYAYDKDENKLIHPGETVYLHCGSDCKHTGQGIVTLVDGTSYTVEITEGLFESGETVRVYRSKTYDNTERIGRGSISQSSPVAYTGSGTVTKVYVTDGDQVKPGTLLYETVETDAYTDRILSSKAGIVASVAVSAGDAVEKGALLAEIYPDDAMRLMVEADEYDLRKLRIGDEVSIEFISGIKAEGTVERISGIQQTVETTEDEEDNDEDEDALFAVYITFTSEAPVSYGMTARITTGDN